MAKPIGLQTYLPQKSTACLDKKQESHTHLDLAVVARRQNDLSQSPLGLDQSLRRLQGFGRLLLAKFLSEAQLVDTALQLQAVGN